MGDLAYNFLTQEYPVSHFPDWLGYPSLPDNTSWNIDNPPLDYVSEETTPEFTMPSPSYVTEAPRLLDSFEFILAGISRVTSP